MVENGNRDGEYTVQNFLDQVALYEYIAYGVTYAAPGIAEDSS